jgi:hypothetical protein
VGAKPPIPSGAQRRISSRSWLLKKHPPVLQDQLVSCAVKLPYISLSCQI